ncbi:hypothetical protein BH24CHL6_BH24CHL6_15290 [soil metagenome]
MRARFRPRLGQPTWKSLAASVPAGARPVHAFHVLDVFPKVGLKRSEQVDKVLQVIDSCSIRWGRVQERTGDMLIVNAVPLALADGNLVLGEPRAERSAAGATALASWAKFGRATSSPFIGIGPAAC